MNEYDSYLRSLRLVIDGPGTLESELAAIVKERDDALAELDRKTRDAAGRWMAAERRLIELLERQRALTSDVRARSGGGLAHTVSDPNVVPCERSLEDIEASLESAEVDLTPVARANEWLAGAQAQLFQRRSEVGR